MVNFDTNLRISRREISELLPIQIGENQTRENLEATFAHLAWSVICEPGDGFAGMLVAKLGAAHALETQITNLSSKALRETLLTAGNSAESLDKYGVFEKVHQVARERWGTRVSLQLVKNALYSLQKIGGFVLTPQSAEWPRGFNDLADNAPMALWVRGNLQSVSNLESSIAIVGCRGSSSYGDYATNELVCALVEKNLSIVSGGAYGIDGVAHRSTLAMKGNTVAVMAGGVDRLYPTGHVELLRRIIQTGAVVSELPPGSSPTKWRFLQRNRLIAAASQATVVVEANWRSGSLNTASHSEALGREIFAVPGPISSPKSAGTNKLIADGRAHLIVDGPDLLDRLGVQSRVITKAELAGLGAIEVRVLDAIGFDCLEIAEICSAAGLTRDEARFGLGNLELDGLIARRGNSWAKSQTTL